MCPSWSGKWPSRSVLPELVEAVPAIPGHHSVHLFKVTVNLCGRSSVLTHEPTVLLPPSRSNRVPDGLGPGWSVRTRGSAVCRPLGRCRNLEGTVHSPSHSTGLDLSASRGRGQSAYTAHPCFLRHREGEGAGPGRPYLGACPQGDQLFLAAGGARVACGPRTGSPCFHPA